MRQLFTSMILILCFSGFTYGQLVITEFSYNPPESNTDTLEYIELFNAGTAPLNLFRYKFTAGVTLIFPDTTIGAGKYLLLTVNDTAFFRAYGKKSLQWTSGGLNNSGEIVSIADSLNNPVISVDLKDKAPWPTMADGTDGEGKSIELCNPLADPNNGANWKVSANDLGFQVNGKQVFGTPGTANSVPPCSQEPNVTVEVSSNIFTPKDITIEVGQTVRWVNKGGGHNINGTQTTFPNNPESFSNGSPSSALWTFDHTFTKPGLYNYQCDPHASLGMKGTVTVNSPVVTDPYPHRTIASVTSVKSDGSIDSLNVNCTLKGIVYGVNLRAAGLQFTIIDAQNNGIGAFNAAGNLNYTVTEGDEVEIKGQVTQFNGFTQMVLTEVKKLTSGNSLINPKEVTSFVENDESSLIMIKNLTFNDPTQWASAGSGFNVQMSNGSSNFTIRIDNDIDAFTKPIPTGNKFNVTGLLGQFDNTAPYSDGYQLLPRYITDFKTLSASNDLELDANVIMSPNPVTNILSVKTDSNPDFISVYDAGGNLIANIKGSLQIDMSAFKAGMYIIKLVKQVRTSAVRVIKL